MSFVIKAKTRPLAVVQSPAMALQETAAPSSVCPCCYGTEMEVILGKGARHCECRKQDDRAKLLEATRIPARYRECSLSNYCSALGNGSQLQAFSYAFKLVDEYPAVDRGLLFKGTVGVGKTHPSNHPYRADSCAARDRHGY